MATRYERMVMKNGAGAPTIPLTPSHEDGGWVATDVYEDEFYRDTITDALYYRVSNDVIVSVPTSMQKVLSVVVSLDHTDVTSLGTSYAAGFTLITVPVGYGARFTKLPVMKVVDGGTPFVFASGEFLKIDSASSLLPSMCQFTDPAVTNSGSFVAQSFSDHEMTGDAKLYATAAVSGGDPSATVTFTMEYELFEL